MIHYNFYDKIRAVFDMRDSVVLVKFTFVDQELTRWLQSVAYQAEVDPIELPGEQLTGALLYTSDPGNTILTKTEDKQLRVHLNIEPGWDRWVASTTGSDAAAAQTLEIIRQGLKAITKRYTAFTDPYNDELAVTATKAPAAETPADQTPGTPKPAPDSAPEPAKPRQTWQEYFMDMAKMVATRSKDPSFKVGAVIVDARHRVMSTGYNDVPMGVESTPYKYERPQKYLYIAHAEQNAIHLARRDLGGCTIYITAPPCADCVRAIIQSGIVEVVYPAAKEMPERWQASMNAGSVMLKEAKIKVIQI